jgi:hypothetical protein
VVEQAIKETAQSQPSPVISQILDLFLLINGTTVVNIQNDATERAIFQLGNTFGFNLLVKFDGLSYVFLGNFGVFQAHPIIWRLNKLLELLDARVKAIPTRVQAGLATEQARAAVQFFMTRLEIWLIVPGSVEADEISSWSAAHELPFRLETHTLERVMR